MQNKDFRFDRTLAQRFVNDMNLPIQIIDDETFKYWIVLYENDYQSETLWNELWEEIDEECKKLDSNLPSVDGNYSEFPMFIFDCLDKEVLGEILLRHIEEDKDIAVYVARLLHYFEPLVALEYIGVAMSYADLFGFRVFD
jgi:hypothetical protein